MMRTIHVLSVAVSGLLAGAGALFVGCFDYQADCERAANCPPDDGGVDGSDGSDGDSGTGGGVPEGCDPSKTSKPVADKCGVFVSPMGEDGNAGTKEKPLKTLNAALAKGSTIYACAGATPYAEAVVLDKTATLFGALNCGTWAYDASKKTALKAGPDAIPLKLTSAANGAEVRDFAITAADAMTPGGSSIAVLADGAAATLARCDLIAGNGAKGDDGDPGDLNGDPAAAGDAGNSGANACMGDVVAGNPGGIQVTNNCGGDVSIGGKGGDGNQLNGGDGQKGQSGSLGGPGVGEPPAGAWSCAANGTGQGGDNGASGDSGPGATGMGKLSSSGYVGVHGSPGMPGTPGQGGGGGGGAKGGAAICSGMPGAGASGGSGGAGGCGGKPGQGGKAGGASIALVSVQAAITLDNCNLTAGKGGDGGHGGDAQPGGSGGDAGKGGSNNNIVGIKAACDGGKGGQGGDGGPGGGGLGGPSIAVAFRGSPAATIGKTVLTPGTGGTGGPGGSGNVANNGGENGVAAAAQELQ